MPIVTGKTPAGLVQHAQKALNEKWWYVWGTFGNVLTESLLESKAKQYPTYNGGANKAIHRKHLGQTACDCVGLIKGYCMWNDAIDKPVYRSDLDYNTGMMYNAAKVKGPIGTIPDRAGICVYMQGHVGVYIGDGWVIECAGGRGAIRTPLSGSGSTRWTAWFECPFINYGSSTTEKPSSGSSALKAGDRVKVKQGAAPWNGGKLASWVYNDTFDLMELKGERAVIGKGGAVTTAINVKNLNKA